MNKHLRHFSAKAVLFTLLFLSSGSDAQDIASQKDSYETLREQCILYARDQQKNSSEINGNRVARDFQSCLARGGSLGEKDEVPSTQVYSVSE